MAEAAQCEGKRAVSTTPSPLPAWLAKRAHCRDPAVVRRKLDTLVRGGFDEMQACFGYLLFDAA